MRARVSVTTRNRLLRLERYGTHVRYVGGWPPIMDLDEWEDLATRVQDELIAAAHGETQAPLETVVVLPLARKADDGLGEQRDLSAIEGYLSAQRKLRERGIQSAF